MDLYVHELPLVPIFSIVVELRFVSNDHTINDLHA